MLVDTGNYKKVKHSVQFNGGSAYRVAGMTYRTQDLRVYNIYGGNREEGRSYKYPSTF